MGLTFRTATLSDLNNLVALENRSFAEDRINRRAYHHLLTQGNAHIIVSLDNDELVGAVILHFRKNSPIARLYSIAVSTLHRTRGVGKKLVQLAEFRARENKCSRMRLEIKITNTPSLSMFEKMGYRQFGTYLNYYEDGQDAARLEKSLVSLNSATTGDTP